MNKERVNIIKNSLSIKYRYSFKVSWIFDLIIILVLIIIVGSLVNTIYKDKIILIDSISALPFFLALFHMIYSLCLKREVRKTIISKSQEFSEKFMIEDLKKLGCKNVSFKSNIKLLEFRSTSFTKNTNLGNIEKNRPNYVSKYAWIRFPSNEWEFMYEGIKYTINGYFWRMSVQPYTKFNQWEVPYILTFTKDIESDSTEFVYKYDNYKKNFANDEIPLIYLDFLSNKHTKRIEKKCFIYVRNRKKSYVSFRIKNKIFKGRYYGFIKWSLKIDDLKENIAKAILKDYERKLEEFDKYFRMTKSVKL